MDRRTRVQGLFLALLIVIAGLGFQSATASPAGTGVTQTDAGQYPGQTLITVQSFRSFTANNGRAFVVDQNGTLIWQYDPADSRVFDGEQLQNGNLLFSVATAVPAADCPPTVQATNRFPENCVKNRVVEIDPRTDQIEWEYAWYDAFIHWHEVHDADRLPTGETAVIDMGNDRAFTVNQAGNITWEWNARDKLGPGSDFWTEYVPADSADQYRPSGPESDWTHMNDIDHLANGNFQVSIRNFDVVIELNPETNRITAVIGRPGQHGLMHEQHDPNRLAGETLLIADSENNRLVEYDLTDRQEVWAYYGTEKRLQWPRDADRLPNGNTLIVDSRNNRVIEINPDGEVVWEYSLEQEVGLIYDAERLGLPEEPDAVPTGRDLATTDSVGIVTGVVSVIESWAGFVFPAWVRFPELLLLAISILLGLALAVDGAWFVYDTRVRD